MNIKLFVVDLYGVIAKGNYHDICTYLADKYDKKEKDVYNIVYHKYFNQAASGKISEDDSFKLALEELNMPEDWQEIREKHLQYVNVPDLESTQFFQKMEKEGYGVVLFSKNTPGQFNETVTRLKLKEKFTNVINGYDFNIKKGTPEAVEFLSKKFSTTPREMVFIDDQDFNLTVPKQMGAQVFLYKNFEQFIDEFTAANPDFKGDK